MTDPFRSKRLQFTAIDLERDVEVYHEMTQDSTAQMQLTLEVPRPSNREHAKEMLQHFMKNCFLAVWICLPAAEPSEGDAKPTPIHIGRLILSAGPTPTTAQHRHCMIGLTIISQHRNRGYGGEAIEWVLEWAFRRAGMHKVSLGWFGWNADAGRLYAKLGFVREATFRKQCWHNGRWWDTYEAGMLVEEWEAQHGALDRDSDHD